MAPPWKCRTSRYFLFFGKLHSSLCLTGWRGYVCQYLCCVLQYCSEIINLRCHSAEVVTQLAKYTRLRALSAVPHPCCSAPVLELYRSPQLYRTLKDKSSRLKSYRIHIRWHKSEDCSSCSVWLVCVLHFVLLFMLTSTQQLGSDTKNHLVKFRKKKVIWVEKLTLTLYVEKWQCL